MAVPKKKTGKSKTNSRKSANMKFTAPSAAHCSRCGAPRMSHRVCPACGYYKNRQVVEVTEYE
jgi:large subunit ribosomal protein L32